MVGAQEATRSCKINDLDAQTCLKSHIDDKKQFRAVTNPTAVDAIETRPSSSSPLQIDALRAMLARAAMRRRRSK
jgi:hypothetical protein